MAREAIGCETCGADTVQRLPLFWASHPALGSAGLVGGVVPAPPTRPGRLLLIAALTLGVGLGVMAALPGMPADLRRILAGAALGAVVIAVVAIFRYRMRLDDWREALETWAAQWICLRCGAVTDDVPRGQVERPRRAAER